jgi:dolichyl-diphosphooligosaccharide--protein glycosyltransferase
MDFNKLKEKMINLEYLKKQKTWPLLFCIFLMGFSVIYLAHGPRLADPDAWFQYRMAKYVLEQGGIPENDPMAYYPDGRRPWIQDTLVLPYFFAYTYKLFAPLGISLMGYAMLFPAIFGGLASIALYLAAKELFDKRIALFSALLYAFSPLALSRVYAGTIDKEVLYGVFAYTSLYFFLRACKTEIKNPRTLVNPVLSGIFFGLAYANWSGGGYIILVISVSALIYFLFKRDTNMMKAMLIMGIVGALVMELIQPPKYSFNYFLHSPPIVFLILISSIPLFSISISNFINKKYGREISFPVVLCVSLFVGIMISFMLGYGDIIKGYISAPISYLTLAKGYQQDLYMATVAESQPAHLLGSGENIIQKIMNGDLFRNLNMTLFVLPFGAILLILRLKDKKEYSFIFTLVWVISGILAADQGMRLLFFLAPSAAVVTSFTFFYSLHKLKSREDRLKDLLTSSMKPKIKLRTESDLTNTKYKNMLLLFLLFFVTFPMVDASVSMMDGRRSDLPAPWIEAMEWIKTNTPENSVILHWWDYGYYTQAIAERYSVVDGGGNVPRNIDMAKMFTSPENESMKYIKKYVDYEKVPAYMLVSYEEFGKSGAINRIGQDELYIGAVTVYQILEIPSRITSRYPTG